MLYGGHEWVEYHGGRNWADLRMRLQWVLPKEVQICVDHLNDCVNTIQKGYIEEIQTVMTRMSL